MIYCHWSKSLGALEDTAENIWHTEPYNIWKHSELPCVFFGMYDLRDYLTLKLHTGKSWILWAGSDLLNLKNEFIFNDGKLRWLSKLLKGNKWILKILKKAEDWVENEKEAKVLESLEIKISGICPSFLGNINNYEVSYIHSYFPHVYLSASEGRQEEYGFGIIELIADKVPDITFHLYGASWRTKHNNVIVHGRIPKEQMNEQIKKMQAGIRLNEFDGASEIIVKSILYGQYPIGKVSHPFVPSFKNDADLIKKLNMLKYQKEPNYKVREWWIKNLNKVPWNINLQKNER